MLPDQASAQSGRAVLPDQAQAEQLQMLSAGMTVANQPHVQRLNAGLTDQAQVQVQQRPMDECGFAEGDMLVLSIEGKPSLRYQKLGQHDLTDIC